MRFGPPSRGARLSLVAWTLAGALTGCGSRTEPSPQPIFDGREGSPCRGADDCESTDWCHPLACVDSLCRALEPVSCETDDPCLIAACEPSTGECVTIPLTKDADGDGHRAPLPGFRPGEPGSCGDDCDDTRAGALPGGAEVCDGIDNDCDGVVDNGSVYLDPTVMTRIPDVTPLSAAGPGTSGASGIAFGEGRFFTSYWAEDTSGAPHTFLRGFWPSGEPAVSERPVSLALAPSFEAAIAWAGDGFGVVWSDARVDDNYEIFFAAFSSEGEKLGPEVRVTTADDFSIHPELLFDQGRFVLVFTDWRDPSLGPAVYGQLLDTSGTALGPQVTLSTPGSWAEYPTVVATATRLAVVYTVLDDGDVGLELRIFDKQLNPLGGPIRIETEDPNSPVLTAMGDTFLLTWDVYGPSGPGEVIRGATFDESGNLLRGPLDLTAGAAFARTHAVVSLGDRVLLAWADTLDDNYEIYAKVLDRELNDVEPRRRLTEDPSASLGPSLALSDEGRIGVVFDDWRSGSHQAYLLTLGCSQAPGVP